MGHALESAARSDPSILLAAQNLVAEIPSLARSLIESHPHIGQSDPGPAHGYFRNGEFRVRSRTLDDGTLVQPVDEAEKSLAKILAKKGYSASSIKKAMEDYREAPLGQKVSVVPSLDFVKWGIDNLQPDLGKAEMMNPLIPAKIAFEFLACHAGDAFYSKEPQLETIRRALLTLEMQPSAIEIERLSSGKYEPFHGLLFEGNDPHARVQVRLFGWLAFRVHFLRLSVSGPRFVYTHRLDTSEERVDITDN